MLFADLFIPNLRNMHAFTDYLQKQNLNLVIVKVETPDPCHVGGVVDDISYVILQRS